MGQVKQKDRMYGHLRKFTICNNIWEFWRKYYRYRNSRSWIQKFIFSLPFSTCGFSSRTNQMVLRELNSKHDNRNISQWKFKNNFVKSFIVPYYIVYCFYKYRYVKVAYFVIIKIFYVFSSNILHWFVSFIFNVLLSPEI